jgi:DNA (cytosine-5)-methyltransferase 1
MNGKPTVISMFAGCGGSSLGYKWAGYNELLAVEWDQHAVETFKDNFPGVPVWQKDVSKIKGKDILHFTNLNRGELDVLDGSPPCQGFSTSGKRKTKDQRNNLSQSFIRLIDELQPKTFVMENVTGMIRGKMKGYFNQIGRDIENVGYEYKAKIMNAKHYDVAQSRNRIIWVGSRVGTIAFPKPSKKTINVETAIKGLAKDESITISKTPLTCWKKCKPGEQFSKYHPKGHWFNAVKCDPSQPVPTLLKTIANSETRLAGHFHWEVPRHLNIAELKRCCSFPDEFVFKGTFTQQVARLGNAVMPKFMEHIARTIKTEMLNE